MRAIDADTFGIGKCNPDVFEDKGYAAGWNAAIKVIESAPTLDVAPVIHAHLAFDPEYSLIVFYKCSNCGKHHFQPQMPYCGYCGAKIDFVIDEDGSKTRFFVDDDGKIRYEDKGDFDAPN